MFQPSILINKSSRELGRPGSNSESHARTWQHRRAGLDHSMPLFPSHLWFIPQHEGLVCTRMDTPAHNVHVPPPLPTNRCPLATPGSSGTHAGGVAGPLEGPEVGLSPPRQEFQGTRDQEGALGKPFPLATWFLAPW